MFWNYRLKWGIHFLYSSIAWNNYSLFYKKKDLAWILLVIWLLGWNSIRHFLRNWYMVSEVLRKKYSDSVFLANFKFNCVSHIKIWCSWRLSIVKKYGVTILGWTVTTNKLALGNWKNRQLIFRILNTYN